MLFVACFCSISNERAFKCILLFVSIVWCILFIVFQRVRVYLFLGGAFFVVLVLVCCYVFGLFCVVVSSFFRGWRCCVGVVNFGAIFSFCGVFPVLTVAIL